MIDENYNTVTQSDNPALYFTLCRSFFKADSRFIYSLQNPFTAKSFCNGNRAEMASRRGSSFCPHHYGRAKLLIQPSKHKHELREVHIHGRKIPNATAGIVHFDTSEAHIKEWPGQFETYSPTVRLPQDYTVSKDNASSVGIHSFEKAHKVNENGTFTMYYDPDLESWLDFIASRRRQDTFSSNAREL